MVIFWVVGEMLIKRFDLSLAEEIAGGKAYQRRLDVAERANHIVLAEDRRQNVRHSPEWNEQIKGWRERKKLMGKVKGLNKWSRAKNFYFLFWCLFVLSQYIVCITAPKVKSYSRQYGMGIYFWTLTRQMGSPSFAGPYDYIIWSVVFLEALLFFSAAAVVKWPKPPLIRGVGDGMANKKFYNETVPKIMNSRSLYPSCDMELHLFVKDTILYALRLSNGTPVREIDFEEDEWRHDN